MGYIINNCKFKESINDDLDQDFNTKSDKIYV